MFPSAPGNLLWRVSRSCDGGACIMVARHDDAVIFGNTRHPNGPVSRYTLAEWKEFLVGAKRGDFDDLC